MNKKIQENISKKIANDTPAPAILQSSISTRKRDWGALIKARKKENVLTAKTGINLLKNKTGGRIA